MKRILFVTSALGGGGAERVLSIIAKYLQNSGFQVKVVSLISDRHEYDPEKELDNVYIGGTKNKLLRNIERYTRLKRTIMKFSPDYIISFGAELNIYTLTVAKKNCRIIISERNDPNISPKKKIIRNLRNKLYKKADFIVFQTKDARDYFSWINDEKCCIIQNPISNDLPLYVPDVSEEYIFSAGRLNTQKNFPLLLNAFANLHRDFPKIRLKIAGDGPEKNKLESLCKELSIHDSVDFLGFTTDIHEYMKKCRMFVLTSDYEGMSNVMLEALAIGVPTICTDCPIGGARMVIDNNKNGILIPTRDCDATVRAMTRIIENTSFANDIGKAATKIRESHSIESICGKWLFLINELGK